MEPADILIKCYGHNNMKVSISYPPLGTSKGIPMLSQNRQFQWYNEPTYVYPVIPAYAATLLKRAGYDVSWDDCIAEGITPARYVERMVSEAPDVIVMETKTPVIKLHWGIINELKSKLPRSRLVLVGDHVTALPEESMKNSEVDYILTGGDYDFLLLNLCNHISRGEKLEDGIWYKENGSLQNTGKFKLDHDLNSLPFIDRELTRWQQYSAKNGNFKNLPGTYTMAGRDCWWHRCTFCAWTVLYPRYRVRKPESLLDEIGTLIEKYRVREIFDDTGTFPPGQWLDEFCRGMIERGYHRKVRLGCNMRFGIITQKQYHLMKKAGFRLLLFGFESANQETLDHLNKGIKVNDIIESCMMAKKAGLEPHLTVMVGYPWESRGDAGRTLELARDLFRKGHADTLQATMVIPYPGTPLYEECKTKQWLSSQDWTDYDMRQMVLNAPIKDEDAKELTQSLYRVFFIPRYVISRLTSIRSLDDIKFIWRGFWKVLGHLKDFAS